MSLRFRTLWPLALLAAAASCSSDNVTLPNEGLPAAMAVLGGNRQTAIVGTPLPDSLTVRVTDSKSRPVEGIKVRFTPILGGGDVIPDTAVTNADGRTGVRWVMGTTAGAQRVQAMVVGATASGALTQNFDATATAALADTVFAARGNGQSGVIGGALADSLVVRITDRYGNSVSGSPVVWSPIGGGSVSPSTSATGAAGTAATNRTLGTTAGAQGATASAAGLKGSPVTFSMTALPAAPTSLVKVTGDNQSGSVGTPVTDSLVVRLLDGSGNGVPGRNVTFAIATGGGSASPTSATTDSVGRAATRWTLGPLAGGNSLIVSSSGFSVTFLATGNSAAASALLANSPVSQNGTAGLPAGSPPSVRVNDANGNPVAGVSVSFAVTGGGGSILPVTPVTTNASGIATLGSWVLGTVAGPNSVTATVAGLTPSSVTFTANGTAGSAAQLQVQTQPSSSAQSGVALAVQPTVRLADVFGNAVTSNGVAITAALATGSGSLGGTLTASTVGGIASFTDLAITGPTGTYTIRFSSGSLTPDTSAVIAIGAGIATRLAITIQPSASAQNGVAFAQQPRVQVQDAAGNPVAGVRSVTVGINSGGGALGGTTTLNTDAAGLATFAGLSITGATGGRTLVFSSTGLTSIVSGTVTVTAGAPTQMAINAGNGQTATAASAVAIPPSVVVRDVSNNPVAGVAVTFAVAGGSGSVLPVAAVNTNASGVAAATSWTLGSVAGSNTLTATAAPAGITPNPVTFTATGVAGGAGGIGMVTQPSATVVNGAVISQAPVVQVLDVNGNAVATPTSVAITVGIASGPGGTLAGLTTVGTNASGRATFSGLSIAGLAGAYTLQFTSPSLTGVTSAAIALTAGAATQVKITTEPPANAQSGIAMAPPTVVQLQDVSGNAVSTSGTNIVAALVSGGGTLTGTLTVPTVAGGASTFSNLILTGTAGPRIIRFTSGALTPDTSTAIALGAGTATQLEYVVQPSAVTAGQNIAPAVTVRVRDGAGNTVTTATNMVTMAIGTNPGGSTLGGTLTANAVAGVATFGALTLNKAGAGYTLVASATGLTSATSAGLTVTSAGATTIAANSLTSQTDTAGLPAAAPPSVLVTDANGNPVAGVAVTFAVTAGGGSIVPVTPVPTNASGVATLTSWTLGNLTGANTVTASGAGLTPALITFSATGVSGTATQLVVVTQPSASAQSGVALTQQPAVRLADAFGNAVATTGTNVTAAIASGGGSLAGTTGLTTVGGVATFTNLAITGPTGAYTLQFASAGLTPVTSTTIGIGAGVATQLAMGTQPSASVVNGAVLAVQPTVQLRDAANNPVLQSGTVVTAALQGGGTLGGTLTATTNASGLATFTSLSITGLVGARTLQFTSGSLSPVTSSSIGVTAGPATQIAVNAGNGQSATVNTAVLTPPSVVVRDISGNPVTGVSVTFAVASGGGSIVPLTPATTNASGVAALTSWTLGTLAGSNTVTATSGTLTGSPVTFTATGTAGAATQLQMATQPSPTAQSGAVLAVQPAVRLADAFGNLVNAAGTPVTAGFGSGTGTLGGTLTVNTTAGVATFTNLSIAGASGPYTLRFTSGALAAVTSNAVTLGAGSATRLAVVQQPSTSAQNATAFALQPTVQVEDAAGNPVAGVVSVTASIATGGGTLGGTTTVSTNAAGLATFTNLAITGTVGARTLQFASGALTPDTSGVVSVTAGSATQIAVNAGNGQTATVNTAVATAPSAIVRDVSGNAVAGVAVTFAVTGGGGSVLPVAAVVTNASGVAALTSWTMGTLAGANTMTATSGTLTGSPVLFTATATAGAATQLQMATQPSPAAQSGAAFAVQPAIQLADAFGNPVATNGTTITAAFATGTGTLGGTLTANTVAGVATFTNLSITGVAGPYTLRFTSGALTAAISGTITLGAGGATRLVMVTQPSATAQNAIAFPQQPQVQVQDAAGNPVAGVASVTVTILTGGGTLLGTATVSSNGAGLATFAGLSIAGTVGARTLQFTSGALSAVTSTAVTLTAGTPKQVAVSAGNGQTATAGTAVAIPPAVIVRDTSSNPVPGVSVTFAIASGSGSVQPVTSVTTNASGIAAATSWTLGTAAGANSLSASAAPAGISGNPVTFTATAVAGSAGKLAMFTQPPATAQSGATISPAPVVQLQDSLGNAVTTFNFPISVAIASGPGGVLSGGTVATTNTSGRAAFSTLMITGPTGVYTLQFTGTGVTGVTSGTITLTAGGAARLAVVTQPTTAQSGIVFPSATTVQVQDAAGNPVAAAKTISVISNSGTATLSGTTSQATNGTGLATFSNLVLTGPTGPNTLLFSTAGLTSDTTAAITLTAGTATQMVMVQQPSASAPSGVALAQQPSVQVQDASGNPVSGVVSVTAAILTGGGTLGGTVTVSSNASGLATFTNLAITGTVGVRTLRFTSGALTAPTSSAVNITAGAATQLTMVQQPSASAASGVNFALQPTVQVRDASGNPVAGVASVTAAILTGGGTLGGVTTINTDGTGLATFAGLSITGTVGARTLQFTSGALTPVTSGTVTITAGAPSQMSISAGNAQSAVAGAAVAIAPAVLVRDASNNPVSGVSVTFAVAGGGGTVLPAAAVTTNASGVAAANSWTLGTVAGPNSLTATAAPGGITPNPVTFTATGTPGVATQLVMVQQPSATAANGIAFAQQPTVQVRDALGNAVPGVVSVTATILTGGGTLGGTATVSTDAGGLATFAGLAITGTAGARTLQFASGALTVATSSSINVTAGAAARLAMVQQPSASAQNALAFAQQPTVQVQDVSGNAVPGVVSVTAAIASGGGALGGVTTVNTNAGGLATFAGLSITGTVGARTLQFTSGVLTPVTSTAVGITAGAATQLVMVQQPSATAASGTAFAQQPTVQVQDASGNAVSGVVSVTAAILSGGGALGGTATVSTNAGGLATFAGLSITGTVGSRTLQFTSGALTAATSTAVSITAGAATQLVMVQQPSATAASGTAFAQQPTVQVQDASGNAVSGVVSVTAAIASGGGALGGTATVSTNAGGLATFAGLSITGTVGARTLQFTSGALTPVTSTAVGITAGTATQLVMVQQPSATAASGTAFAQQPTVQVEDASGNAVSGVVSVTAAILTGGGALGGTATVSTNAGGLASFAGLSITGTVGARTLQFTSGVLTAATSTAVSISAGAPTQMAVSAGDAQSATVGTTVATAPAVLVRDVSGNPVAGVSVTFAAASGGGSALPVAAVLTNAAGIATATSWTLGTVAGPNTLTATAGPAGIAPNPVTFTATGTPGAAAKLVMVQQPSATAASGTAFAQQPTVQVEDASGNAVSGVVSVTAAIASGGGALGGTATVSTNAGGLASFAGLSITGTVGARTLQFTSGVLTAATSAAVTLSAGAPTQMAVSAGDAQSTTVGTTVATAPAVLVRDVSGNPVAGVSVTFAAASGGGSALPVAAVLTNTAGIAAASSWTLGTIAGPNTLTATAGPAGIAPNPVTFTATGTAGAATALAITTAPTAGQSGIAVLPQPVVRLVDAYGNPVSTSGTVVTATLASGTGTLTNATATTVNGVATFSGLAFTGTVGNIQFSFNANSLAGATTGLIPITAGTPAALAFSVQPVTTLAGVAIPTPQVEVRDAAGNRVTTATTSITVAIGNNPSAGTLTGTATQGAVAGLASFPGLSINKTGTGYTLTANGGSLTQATSAGFDITPATPASVAFITQPSAVVAGASIAPAVQVEIRDGLGNRVTTSTASVTVAIGTNPGLGTLSGSATLNAAAGVATFANLSIDKSGVGYTLAATSGVLTGSASTAFTVNPGAASALAITTMPTAGQSGAALSPAAVVRLVDLFGNTVTTTGITITAALSSGNGTLGGTVTANTASGLATFSNLILSGTVGSYTINFSSGSLTSITSGAIALSAGSAATIVANSSPGASGTVGTAVTPLAAVKVTDASGNPVSGVAVTFAVTAGNGSITGGSAATDVNGVATVGSWTRDLVAGADTLTATATGLTGSPVRFTTLGVAGAATQVAANSITSQSATVNTAVGAPPSVLVRDVNNNPVSGATVTFAVTGGGGTLGAPTAVQTLASGIATATSWTLGPVAGPNTVTATVGALTPVTFNATGTAGAATKLGVIQQPSTSAASGATLVQQPTVQVQDAGGNPVAESGTVVTASIATGGGTLGGTLTATTNAGGIATFTNLSITGTVGPRTLQFTSAPVRAAATSGSINLTVGAASAIAANSATTQSDTVGLPVAAPPSVKVTDTGGNPVAGVSVTFAVTAGTGSILPVTATPVVTDAGGIATLTSWTLGALAGTNTVTATVAGLVGSPVTFTATGTPGAATRLAIIQQPSATEQNATVFARQPTVQLQDALGNSVGQAGVVVAAAILSGGGALGGTATATTNSGGLATFTGLSITGTVGARTLQFTSGSLTPITSASVAITAGAATQIVLSAGDGQTATAGSAVTIAPAVLVRDVSNNPVANVGVTFAVATGGGTVVPVSAVATDASGIAKVTSWTLGTVVGTNTLTATAAGLTGSPITFTATGAVGAATQIAAISALTQSGTVNTAVATPPSVVVRDANNNPVAGVAVTFAVTGGGGSILPVAASVTNASGIATLASWTLGTVAGANTLTATATGLGGSPVTFTATGNAGAATQLAIVQQPSGSATSGFAFGQQPTVQVEDAFGNPVAGAVSVSVTLLGGVGTLGGTFPLTTNGAGLATFTDLVITGDPGSYSLQFSSGGLASVTSSSITL